MTGRLALSEANVAAYLAERGLVPVGVALRVTPLGGGVSNAVLRVQGDGVDWVLKQPLPKLRVEADWPADVSRIRVEGAFLRFASQHLPGCTPALVFEDEAHDILAMTAVSDDHQNWKAQLLSGRVDPETAHTAGELLGRLHARTWNRARIGAAFDDLVPFDQLRIDPYFRTVMQRHPDVAQAVQAVIERMEASRQALVHGDYSPKNIMVGPTGLVLLDFEVADFGDPAFDVAFCVNHLLLKALHLPDHARRLLEAARRFLEGYGGALGERRWASVERRAIPLLGALQLARVDGKSPAEYLRGEGEKQRARSAGKRLLVAPPADFDAVFDGYAAQGGLGG